MLQDFIVSINYTLLVKLQDSIYNRLKLLERFIY